MNTMTASLPNHDNHAASSNDQPSLDSLPDEILCAILNLVAPVKGMIVAKEIFTLMMVCRKWREIYEPILFQTIKVHAKSKHAPIVRSSDDPAASRAVPRLRHIVHMLQKHPHLRSYPKFLELEIDTDNILVPSLLDTIVKLCSSIEEVDLVYDYDKYPEKVLSACSNLPHLRYMSLKGPGPLDPGPSLSTVFSLPLSLDCLRLEGYGLEHADQEGLEDLYWLDESLRHNFQESRDDRELLLPPSSYHSSKITTLQLIQPRCRLNATEHILRWPAQLTNLMITNTPDWLDANHFTLPVMQKFLDLHRNTLEYISVGEIYSEDRNIEWGKSLSPDFSLFPHLKQLRMKAANIVTNDNPLVAARKLSAPQLELATLVFGVGEYGSCEREDFLQEHAMWFELFARLKYEQYPDSKLTKVDVLFDPDVDPVKACKEKRDLEDRLGMILDEEADPTTWPWKYAEKALNAMATYGLKMTFQAQWKKQHWKRLIHDIESGADEVSTSGSDNFWGEFDSEADSESDA